MSIESNILDKFVNFGYMRNSEQKISMDYAIVKEPNGVRTLMFRHYHKAKLDHAGNLITTTDIRYYGCFSFGSLTKNFDFVKKLDDELFLYKRKPTIVISTKAGTFCGEQNGDELQSLIRGYKWEGNNATKI